MTALSLHSKRRYLFFLWLLAACAPDVNRVPAEVTAVHKPIVSGTADAADPAVVGIGLRRVDCDALLDVHCTGTLIAPRLVLTAAHCVNGARTASNLEVLFGRSVTDPAALFARVVQVQLHPDYRVDGDLADLAILVLQESMPVAPVALHAAALDGSWIGHSVRVVGFGQTQASGTTPGEKRAGTSTISEVHNTQFRTIPGPSLSCHGDSGGPLFSSASGSELLVGVTTKGDPGCRTYGLNVRIDTALRDFIQPWLDRTLPSTPPAKVSDAALLCTASCGSDVDCPPGLRCQFGPTDQGLAARCVIPGLLAGALSAECTGQTDCTERCVRVLPNRHPAACRCYSACATETPPDSTPGCSFGRRGSAASGFSHVFLALLFVLTLLTRNMTCLR